MTTIAIDMRKRVVAADSKVSWGDKSYSTHKIFTLADGTVIAYAGYTTAALIFVRWYAAGADLADPPKFPMKDDVPGEMAEFEAVVLTPDGDSVWDQTLVFNEIKDDRFYTIGTGSHYAMSALHFGRSPEEAVRFAIKLDSESGGRVKVVEAPKKKRRKASRPKSL